MNREEALTAMKADIELAATAEPGWSDEITFTHNGQDYTPNQLIKEAEAGTEAGLAFIDQVYIPNAETDPMVRELVDLLEILNDEQKN